MRDLSTLRDLSRSAFRRAPASLGTTPRHAARADGRSERWCGWASDPTVARFAEIGQMAAGILHEVNNAVAVLPASVGALSEGIVTLARALEDAPGGATHRRARARASGDIRAVLRSIEGNVDDIGRSAEMATSLLLDFRSLAHGGCEEPRPTDIHECIETALRLAGHPLRHHIRVERDFGTLPPLAAHPRLLVQVFLNLFVNASQFTEGEGILRIRTCRDGDEALVEVSDTGKGISPADMQRLFRPLFTTRPAGEGLGLGLTISKKIIERHGGRIEATSVAGRGATFHIHLPLGGPEPRCCGKEGFAWASA